MTLALVNVAILILAMFAVRVVVGALFHARPQAGKEKQREA